MAFPGPLMPSRHGQREGGEPVDGQVIAQFPHCDSRVLHAPGECEYCDGHQEWQELRRAWGIAFTGHQPKALLPECGRRVRRPGLAFTCRQAAGHGGDHMPAREWETMPCPADASRPAGSKADHRRWGGNKPTTATGDPGWPAETSASRAMYGDRGGRAPWPLPERLMRRARRPLEVWRLRRDGWHRDTQTGWWRFP